MILYDMNEILTIMNTTINKTNRMIEFNIPQDIEPEAREYMKSVCSMLTDNGVMEDVDKAALTMLARNYSMFIKANKQLEKDGLTVTSDRGNIAQHPLVKVARDAQNSAVKLMEKFGLTVKDRSRLPGLSEGNDDSPLAQFVKQSKEVR